jgi:hypothetical protein
MMLMRFKTLVLATSTILVSMIGLLVLLELVLWLFPVKTGLRWETINATNPVPRFEAGRAFVFSDEWNFAIVNRGWINNAGFVNDHDYLLDDPRPLISVVGDSYVEAEMVPYAQTFHGILQAQVGDRARVYSFGASGLGLSQYLGFAEYARSEYRTQIIFFNIVGNDFDESLAKYKRVPGTYSYVSNGTELLLSRLDDYKPSRIRRLLRRSNLARYLFFNLEISGAYAKLRDLWRANNLGYAGNAVADTAPERLADSIAVIRAFFRDLPKYSGLPPECIGFVVDGVRDMIYAPANGPAFRDSFAYVMRTRFITIARELGYEVVDLHSRFAEHFTQHRRRFEFATDGHWNDLGHAVAAQAIQASDLFGRFQAEISRDSARHPGSSTGLTCPRRRRRSMPPRTGRRGSVCRIGSGA